MNDSKWWYAFFSCCGAWIIRFNYMALLRKNQVCNWPQFACCHGRCLGIFIAVAFMLVHQLFDTVSRLMSEEFFTLDLEILSQLDAISCLRVFYLGPWNFFQWWFLRNVLSLTNLLNCLVIKQLHLSEYLATVMEFLDRKILSHCRCFVIQDDV